MKKFQKYLTIDVMKKFQKKLTFDVMKKFQKMLTFDDTEYEKNTDSSCLLFVDFNLNFHPETITWNRILDHTRENINGYP